MSDASNHEHRLFNLEVAATAAAFGRAHDEEYGVYYLADALKSFRELYRSSQVLSGDQFGTLAGSIGYARSASKDVLPAKSDRTRLLNGLRAALMLTEELCMPAPHREATGAERDLLDQILIAHHDMTALSMTIDMSRRIKEREQALQNCVVIDFSAKRAPSSGWEPRP